MLSFSISYWDLIKFSYFAETTERGDKGLKEAQRQGDIMDKLYCLGGLFFITSPKLVSNNCLPWTDSALLLFFKFVEILITQKDENACYNSVSLVHIIV